MKVKAVVFDLGKVLVDFDYGIAARKLAEKSVLAVDEVRALIDQSPLLFRYERAGMTTQEFFAEVRQRIGYTGSLTYSYGTEVRSDEVRAFPIPTPTGGTEEVDRFEGSTGRETVLWGGLLNLSTMLGSDVLARSSASQAICSSGSSMRSPRCSTVRSTAKWKPSMSRE